MRKVLVTGATGFIGNHVIEYLLTLDNIDVLASSRDMFKAKKYPWFDKVTYIPYDIANVSNDHPYDYFKNVDCLIHLAWDGLLDYNNSIHIDSYLFQHYEFINKLAACGLKDITVCGTCLEVGMKDGCYDENICTRPSTNYGLAKDTLRKFLESKVQKIDGSLKWVRLFYLYGPGQREKSVIGQLEKAFNDGAKLFAMSEGEQLRDYMPVKTAAEIIVKIGFQNKVCGIINCCSGIPISVRRFVENYIKQKNENVLLDLGRYPYPKYEPFAFWGNRTKLNLILNGQ